MSYKQHTKLRYQERFINKDKKNWFELTDEDYSNLCSLCLNSNNIKCINNKYKLLINYKDTYMWCIISKKNKIIKTIFPIDKSDRRKYLNHGVFHT